MKNEDGRWEVETTCIPATWLIFPFTSSSFFFFGVGEIIRVYEINSEIREMERGHA